MSTPREAIAAADKATKAIFEDDDNRLTRVILADHFRSAIEEATEARDRKIESLRQPPDCALCGRRPHPDTYGHSYRPMDSRAAQPQEWTPEYVAQMMRGNILRDGFTKVAATHNATLKLG